MRKSQPNGDQIHWNCWLVSKQQQFAMSIVIGISHFPPVNDVSWVLLWHVSANTLLSTCAVPSLADSCGLPMMSGIPSFSCHVLASLDIVPNAPTTMGIRLEAWCMSFTSNTSSWYLSTFSLCLKNVLVSRYFNIYKHSFFVFLQRKCSVRPIML